jgi:ACS family tartrate transporter-like MFS transporter
VAFLFMIGLYATGFWMPQSIKAVGRGLDHASVGLLVMIPNVIGLCIMVMVSGSSTRRSERHWHAALSLITAALGFYFVGSVESVPACITLWSVAAAGLYGFIGPFWSMPGEFLTGRAAATAFASICSIGNLGGFFGLSAIGSLAARTGNLAGGFRLVAVALLLSSGLLLAQWYRDTTWVARKPVYECR